jgi:ABC-type transport system involved in cytochrome bd biosynthesis fused ATPase/permease subunit
MAAKSIRGCAESAGRLEELSGLAPDVSDPAAPVALTEGHPSPLALERVSFAYDQAQEMLLRAVDLRLECACRVVLTGASGAGKSTIAQLLARFLDPLGGRVTLGGIDARELAQHELRRHVVLAAQDAHVFTTTIRENLMLANREALEERLWEALAVVGLEAWARSLPDGIDTLLGEDGDLVSGGERRRIALARALVADADYLILDEPTAQLDDETASEMMRAISAFADKRGILVISHRSEDLDGFDEVRLDGGRLMTFESGALSA